LDWRQGRSIEDGSTGRFREKNLTTNYALRVTQKEKVGGKGQNWVQGRLREKLGIERGGFKLAIREENGNMNCDRNMLLEGSPITELRNQRTSSLRP